jgi:hypothetical protein
MTLGRIILLGVLMPAVIGHADMVQQDLPDRGIPLASCDSDEAVEPPVNSANLSYSYSLVDLDLHTLRPLGLPIDTSQLPESPRLQVLTEKEDSLTLCLSALISLGLCNTVPWTYKWAVRGLPQYCWSGCPGMYRPCLAISVVLLHPEPMAPLDPLADPSQDAQAHNLLETTVPLWQESQSTLRVLAARGPPLISEKPVLPMWGDSRRRGRGIVQRTRHANERYFAEEPVVHLRIRQVEVGET